ncbi:hypothetical protein GCM10009774_25290 [Cellulomonas gelida]|nr:hypothetical protein GCM10009774_25290 [Cellulomonas gelida]
MITNAHAGSVVALVLAAGWVRTPDRDPARPAPGPTMGTWLRERFPEHVDVAVMLGDGRFVGDDGHLVRDDARTGRTGSCGSTVSSSRVRSSAVREVVCFTGRPHLHLTTWRAGRSRLRSAGGESGATAGCGGQRGVRGWRVWSGARGAGADEVRERLLAMRAEALDRAVGLGAAKSNLVEASWGANIDDEHDPEGQTIAFERAQVDALAADVRRRLAEVDAALDGLEAGTYGTCAVGGEPIDPERLRARPTATTCVEHAVP